MTHRRTWQKMEQRIGKEFNTQRTALSGENSKAGTSSDTLHPMLYIEAKYRRSFSVINLYKETAEKAKKENKIPVVALKAKDTKGDFILIKLEDLKKIAEELKK